MKDGDNGSDVCTVTSESHPLYLDGIKTIRFKLIVA